MAPPSRAAPDTLRAVKTDSVSAPSARTTLRRKADRGRYERDAIHAILDEALVAHVGFTSDFGVAVLPMVFARVDDRLYLHGATGNHMLRALDGADVCVTFTLVDGLVLSRSAFHHSMNYRSVVVYARAELVTDEGEKDRALRAVVDHMVEGRTQHCRPPSSEELRATRVIRVPLHEASAKVRTGPPIEEPADLALPYFGGEIGLTLVRGAPVPDGL
jgi:nitroimidazol reductase NimA-like FMN-containing flavoprotein (pyridoxamine 5'-phosphate oxidase superfamily)